MLELMVLPGLWCRASNSRLCGTGFAGRKVEDCALKLGASDGKTRTAEGAAIRLVTSRHNFCSPPNTGRIAQRQDTRHLESWRVFRRRG